MFTLNDTAYYWFATNDTLGSGLDGSTPTYDVRLAGASAAAAPVYSGNATLLTHVSYPNGCHEVVLQLTGANGFVSGGMYAIFATVLVDAQNPSGFIGSFKIL